MCDEGGLTVLTTLDFMCFEKNLSQKNSFASSFSKNVYESLMLYLLYPVEFKNTSEIIKFWWPVNTKIWAGCQRVVNVEKATEMSCFDFF